MWGWANVYLSVCRPTGLSDLLPKALSSAIDSAHRIFMRVIGAPVRDEETSTGAQQRRFPSPAGTLAHAVTETTPLRSQRPPPPSPPPVHRASLRPAEGSGRKYPGRILGEYGMPLYEAVEQELAGHAAQRSAVAAVAEPTDAPRNSASAVNFEFCDRL